MKRSFGSGEGETDGSFSNELKKQRPLRCIMREVMGVQCIQKHLPKLEPFLRRLVQEEVEKGLGCFTQSAPGPPSNCIQEAVSRRYRLHFQNSLPHTLFTGSRIEAEGKMPVEIVIIDTLSKKKVTSGPLSSVKIEILVLDGEFGGDGQDEWTEKEFGDKILRERDGKRPLLTGDLVITLSGGVGYLGDANFTDNSSWIRSRKFRLGARLHQGRSTEAAVQEAISGPFFVKDHRGELYKKHHPPSLNDDIWRLEKIGKDGAFHKRLADYGINTVQDFLRNLVMDEGKIRNLLGSGMSNKIWEAILEHAKECVVEDKYYTYSAGQGVVLLFNSIFQLLGAMFDNRFHAKEELTTTQKVMVNKLKQFAYKNTEAIIELNPLMVETLLPRSLPASGVIPVPEPQIPPHQDELTTSLGFFQPPMPFSDLVDPLQLDDYYMGQNPHSGQFLAPLHSFNTKDLDVHYGDISFAGPTEPTTPGDHLIGYNSELNRLWDHGNELGTGFPPCLSGTGETRVLPGKWVKVVAALKWMAHSKRLAAAKKERPVELGYQSLPSGLCSDVHGELFGV